MTPRLTSLFALFVCLTWGSPLATRGAATNAAAISGSQVRGFAGQAVNVPWNLKQTGTVSGVQFDLNYPPSKLTAGVFQAGTLSNNVTFRWREITPGQHRVLFYTKDGAVLGTNLFVGNLPMTVPAGDYHGGGNITINNAVLARTNAVVAAPVALTPGGVYTTPVFRRDDGVVDLLLVVQSNRLWVVQATTNLVNWVNIATNFATLDYVTLTDQDAPNYPARFYRAKLVGTGTGGQISGVRVQSGAGGNQLIFGYATTAGHSYFLQASTNLTSWNTLTTNAAGSNLLNFTNLITPAIPKQFFRILELP